MNRHSVQPTGARSFQPGERVAWQRPGYRPARGIVVRDQGRVALKVQIGGKIYHPLRRHLRSLTEEER